MSFDWYEEVPHSLSLTQGDIFFKFPVPVVLPSDEDPFFISKWTKKDVIVITQACDIEQGKVNEVTFCPISPIETVVAELIYEDLKKGKDNQWKNGSGDENPITIDFSKPGNLTKARKKIDELRKGEYLPFHLLNQTPVGKQGLTMGAKVVLLRDTYQLPLKSALLLAHNKEKYPSRLRLLPPYREHLAQAFANVYSRIGLPQDIKSAEVNLAFPGVFTREYKRPEIED